MRDGDFYGMATHIIGNERLTLEFLRDAGPRIVRLMVAGSDTNLFAETPHIRLPSPHGPYTLYGGHRLWHAPELPARTYVPDDSGLSIERMASGVILQRAADEHSRIARSLEVVLHGERAAVTVRHTLRNDGVWPVELAAWAITQLPPQGVAILPQPTAPLDPDGLLPNRRLVLWPYSRWSDARLELHDDLTLVRGRADMAQKLKVGAMNHEGWAAYLGAGHLLVKNYDPQPALPHPDMGCNMEVYTDEAFLELETLSPFSLLEPGAELSHVETWHIYAAPDSGSDVDALRDLLRTVQHQMRAARHAS